MIFRHSIKNLLRSRKKTIVFFALLLSVTLLLSLAVSVWVSVEEYLRLCDESYETIGLLEYMGPDYPDEELWDAGLDELLISFDPGELTAQEGVISWNPVQRMLGYTEGFHRSGQYVHDSQLAVLVVLCRSTSLITVEQTLYSMKDNDGRLIKLEADWDFAPEPGHYYLITGRYLDVAYHCPVLSISAENFGGERERVLLDVTEGEGFTLPQDAPQLEDARIYSLINDGLDVYAVDDLGSLVNIHQKRLFLTEGRYFTAGEQESGARVCVVTEQLAGRLGLSIGDTLPLSVLAADGATPRERALNGEDFDAAGDFTVVGITNTLQGLDVNVYIPYGSLDTPAGQYGYTLGSFRLENAAAQEFYSAVAGSLPERVQLYIYDQGYAAVAEPFRAILHITVLVTVACALVALSVLALFGYLFIYRQREAAQIMIRLGAGRGRTCRYFLCGSGLLALVSSALGAGVGARLSLGVMQLVERMAAEVPLVSTAFSEGSLSITETLSFVPQPAVGPTLLTGLSVFTLTLLSCLVFTWRCFAPGGAKKGRALLRRGAKSSVMRGGALKYSLLSIRRGGARTVIAPLVALLSALLLSRLVSTADSYELQLERAYADTVIEGVFTDIYGRQTGSQVVRASDLNELKRSGYIDELYMSVSQPFLLYDDVESGAIRMPGGSSFAMETLKAWMATGPKIVFTNSIEHAPEFYYSSSVQVEYMEGYGPEILSAELPGGSAADPNPNKAATEVEACCLVSTEFMESRGLEYGDHISVMIMMERKNAMLELMIVGSYVREGSCDNIYCQLDVWCPQSYLDIDESDPYYSVLHRVSYGNVSFTLTDTAELWNFKEYLAEEGYSEPNIWRLNRTFISLKDKALSSAVNNLTRQIRYVGMLYPCLYVLVGLVGLVGAYLLVLSRRKETAIMRGLGAAGARVFFSVFWEQLILCAAGAALGLGLSAALGMLSGVSAALTGAFVLCWLAGAAFCLLTRDSSALRALREES